MPGPAAKALAVLLLTVFAFVALAPAASSLEAGALVGCVVDAQDCLVDPVLACLPEDLCEGLLDQTGLLYLVGWVVSLCTSDPVYCGPCLAVLLLGMC